MLNRLILLELLGVAIAAAMLGSGRSSRASMGLAPSSSPDASGSRPALSGAVSPLRSRSAFLSGPSPVPNPPARPARTVRMIVTAYCPCEKCCGVWARQAWQKRRLAGGDRLAPLVAGNVRFAAADTLCHPFGTVMEVPGYGRAEVRDRGGAITGPARLDVFFPTHTQALQWGRQSLAVATLPAGRQVIEETPR